MKPARLIAALLVLGAATRVVGQPPWKANPPIVSVKKELYRKYPQEGQAALVFVHYVGPELQRMETYGLEIRDDVHSARGWRFSEDNGRTWSDFHLMPSTDVYYQGKEVWEGGVAPWRTIPRQKFCWASGSARSPMMASTMISPIYRLSRDCAKTWSEPKQLRYEPGPDFNADNPLDPAFLKPNQAYMGNNVLRHSNGTLIHAVGHANAPGDPQNNKRQWRIGSLCFVGKWDPRAEDYGWTAGKRVEISPEVSSRGLMEPAVAELHGGRVLVIWRGSKTRKTPGRKWYSLSTDGGITLDEVRELKYDDGSRFFPRRRFTT